MKIANSNFFPILIDCRVTPRPTASKIVDSQWFHPTGFTAGTFLTKNGKHIQVQGLFLSIACTFAFR